MWGYGNGGGGMGGGFAANPWIQGLVQRLPMNRMAPGNAWGAAPGVPNAPAAGGGWGNLAGQLANGLGSAWGGARGGTPIIPQQQAYGAAPGGNSMSFAPWGGGQGAWGAPQQANQAAQNQNAFNQQQQSNANATSTTNANNAAYQRAQQNNAAYQQNEADDEKARKGG